MKIDFLIGDNDYNSTSYFSRKLSEALRKKGVKTRLFWIGGGQFYKAYAKIINDPPDLTVSFSDVTIGPQKQSLGDAWRIFHLSLLIDPAIYFLHHCRGEYSCISCVDKEDVSFIKSLGFRSVFFLPHGVDQKLIVKPQEKNYDILMLGTCHDYEERKKSWKVNYPRNIWHALEEASEKVLSSKGISCLKALQTSGLQENLAKLHLELDLYVSGKDRVDLVNHLSQFGVHVFGKGPWKKYCPSIQKHPPVSFRKALDLMKQSAIVVNSSPRFKHGSHERILHTLSLGSLPLTSKSSFVEDNFSQSLLTYEYGKGEETASTVDFYLKKREEREALIFQGQKNLEAHTWDERAKTLLVSIAHFLKIV